MTSIPVATRGGGGVCQSHGCAECCYETEMLLAEADARRLEAKGYKREEFSKVDEEGYLTLVNVTPETPEGEESARPRCYFLKDDRCSVYGDRPQGCRHYPWTLDATGIRAMRDEDCPHRAEFPPEAAGPRRMKALLTAIIRESRAR